MYFHYCFDFFIEILFFYIFLILLSLLCFHSAEIHMCVFLIIWERDRNRNRDTETERTTISALVFLYFSEFLHVYNEIWLYSPYHSNNHHISIVHLPPNTCLFFIFFFIWSKKSISSVYMCMMRYHALKLRIIMKVLIRRIFFSYFLEICVLLSTVAALWVLLIRTVFFLTIALYTHLKRHLSLHFFQVFAMTIFFLLF